MTKFFDPLVRTMGKMIEEDYEKWIRIQWDGS